MIERRLARQVGSIGRRLRWLGLLANLSRVWMVAALVAVAALVVAAQSSPLPRWTAPALALGSLAIALLVTWRTLASKIDPVETARHVEACYPDLDARLLAAVEQRPAGPAGQLGYLQLSVIGEALAHGQRDGWGLAAPLKRNLTASAWHCLTLTLFGLALVALVRQDHRPAKVRHAAVAIPAVSPGIEAVIEPGDTELERGKSLLVLARFPGEMPAEVTLVHESSGGQVERLPMSKSLDDPVFAARVPAVQSDLAYHVEFAGDRSAGYQVTVFDYPELERADIKLAFPAYTGLSETLVEDVLQVTAVEGTRLTLIARLNKDVAEARLVGEGQPPIDLVADPNTKHAYVATLSLEKTVRYKLHLADAAGRANKQPDNFTFTVLPNRRPEIKLVFPSRDLQVSPLEELELQATVWDDFGLAAYGISYSLGDQPAREIVLGRQTGAKQRGDARELVSFEQLKAEPDQLLSYYFFADDTGPDGQIRRTSSDMFFCEVRPFEEIFRQGEQPPSESAGKESGNPADKLVELQKQVVAATWKLVRREAGPQPSGEFAKDAPVLLEGQQEVLALADELEAKLHSSESRADLETARKHMRRAIENLQQSVDGPALPPLNPALTAEQAAYQALLKLRAREHLIIHGSGKSKGSASQRSSEQLSQLELKNSENRYEERRTADKQADEAQRETRQVLSRLRELAQRQQDLNERIKEMQSSLQAAQTEQEKEEIRRQLKRLRDEEQQILRDADELRNRMDQPANQQRMADAREQLDQTRANVRRASEALQAGQTSQAAAAGTRAQQQLDQLRDQFRKQAAGRFNDEMRHMRDDARQLEKNEKELGEKLAELDKPKTKSLRDSTGREQVREGLEQQRTNLDKLVDSMRKTVDEAEQAEPLLAKQLYDTIRQTHQQQPAEALDSTRALLERGFVDQARGTEQKAQAGIGRLKQGVERAAETVLGDEAEAIRRARDEVGQLARAVDDEMRRATGEPPSKEPAAQGGDQRSPSQGAESKAGEPKGNGAASGKSKDNEGKNGESKNGESKSGDANGQQGDGKQAPGGESKGGESKPGESNGGTDSKPGSGQQGNSPSPASKSGQQGDQPSGTPSGNSGKSGQPGDKPGDKPGAEGQPSAGQTPSGQASNGQASEGKPSDGQSPAGQPGKSQKPGNQGQGRGGLRELLGTAGGPGGPLTGNDFRPWADRLRDVEEMLDDPALRAEAAKIRDRAAAMRAEFKRHSQEPNWELVRETIYKPLAELRARLAEELLKRQSTDALVPLDRDPVAPSYSEQVRRYYERLGSGQ